MKPKSLIRTLTLSWLFIIIMTSLSSPVLAQTYDFAVPELKMQVYVQPDASARIVYDITFENHGSTIDVVDIGTPHRDYDIRNMSATINGVNLTDIRKSEYIDVGVEVHLGSQAIQRGREGTLHFEFTMPDMVYQDTTDKDLASMQITPTWFDSSLVRGTGTIRIAVHLPEGVHPDDVLYQDVPFSNKALYEDRAVAVWQFTDASATKPYRVGVSFPKSVMTRVIKMTLIELVNKWLVDNPSARIILGAIFVVLFAFLFFRFSGGTGFSVFFILLAGTIFLFVVGPLTVLLANFLIVPLIILNETTLKKRRRKYLPPIAQLEGGGIKRGLTAPEAAVLLEMPLSKVLTLVIFGLLEKGIIEQVQADPLAVRIVDDYHTKHAPPNTSHQKFRQQVALQKGTVMHSYEDEFLDKIQGHPNTPLEDLDFSKPVKQLIEATSVKMKGFDLSDTQDYYRRVIDRAMDQAAALGEIEQREKYLDKYLPWVLMNDRPQPIFTHRGYHYWPRWIRHSRRRGGTSGSGLGAPSKSGSGRSSPGGRTTLGDVAGSFTGWTQNTMGGLAASIVPSSLQVPTGKGGFIDLSGADRVTGDIFESLMESSGSGGGGGGGGCACACAGCACACACAGGGR